jgi:signal transduction histidine kinase
LTGQGDTEVDQGALMGGAADFLNKNELTGSLLDRSIRYAIAQGRIMNDLRESENRCRFLSSQLLSAQEKERRSIARDIHDSIGSSLAAIKFKVESVLMKMREAHPQYSDPLNEIIPFIQGAIEEARRIQMNLRPSILDDFGILATIGWLGRQFALTHPKMALHQEIDIDENEIPGPLKIVIFRVLQEAFNNIAKHSRATKILVALGKINQHIEFSVRDNGVGFDVKEKLQPGQDSRGLGLESMLERVELSGGTFKIESAQKGTVLNAKWPLESNMAVYAPLGNLLSGD